MQPSFPQEIIDLIIDEVDFADSEDLHSCSLVSRSFQRRSQYHLFSDFTLDARINAYANGFDTGRFGDYKTGIANTIEHLRTMRAFLEQSPHIRSYIKILRLYLERIVIDVEPSQRFVADMLDMLSPSKNSGRSAIHTFTLISDISWNFGNSSEDNLSSAIFAFILGEQRSLDGTCLNTGTCQGIKNLVLDSLEFPLDLLQFCSSLETLELKDCGQLITPKVWPRGVSKETFAPRSPPKIKSLSCNYQCYGLAYTIRYLERKSAMDLFTGLEALECTMTRSGDEDLEVFWRLVALNAKRLESLAIKRYNNSASDYRTIYISELPRLRSLHLHFELDCIDIDDQFSYMLHIFELFEPSPHSDSPVTLKEIDIDIEIHTNPDKTLYDVLEGHVHWPLLEAMLMGSRYCALKRVAIEVSIDFEDPTWMNRQTRPLSDEETTLIDAFADQFSGFSSNPNVEFTFVKPDCVVML